MQEEIEKMSSEDLIGNIYAYAFLVGQGNESDEDEKLEEISRAELLKRLSKNNKTINFYSTEEIENLKIEAVEEFKNKLIEEMGQTPIENEWNAKQEIIQLINNIGI